MLGRPMLTSVFSLRSGVRLLHATGVAPSRFNAVHLAQGSDPPAVDSAKLTLYNMRFCMYAHRSVLALLAKGIDFNLVNVNLKSKPDWFLAKSPHVGKVPVVEFGNSLIYESIVVGEFIEEKFPSPALMPSTPEGRARDRYLVELSKRFYGPLHKALRAETDEELKAISAQIKDGLNIFESELESRKSKFLFSSERPGLLDYTIWPWFERLPSFEKRVGSVLGGLPRLSQWTEHMKEDPPVKAYAISTENHISFLAGLVGGTQDYDLMRREK